MIGLDGHAHPKAEAIAERLSEFWLSDENVVYIGKTDAKRGLAGRLHDYYRTALGNCGPHRGGHWIKTLKNMDSLHIYFAECAVPAQVEGILLKLFIEGVSESTRSALRDPDHPFPFANLEYPKGIKKAHCIGKSTK